MTTPDSKKFVRDHEPIADVPWEQNAGAVSQGGVSAPTPRPDASGSRTGTKVLRRSVTQSSGELVAPSFSGKSSVPAGAECAQEIANEVARLRAAVSMIPPSVDPAQVEILKLELPLCVDRAQILDHVMRPAYDPDLDPCHPMAVVNYDETPTNGKPVRWTVSMNGAFALLAHGRTTSSGTLDDLVDLACAPSARRRLKRVIDGLIFRASRKSPWIPGLGYRGICLPAPETSAGPAAVKRPSGDALAAVPAPKDLEDVAKLGERELDLAGKTRLLIDLISSPKDFDAKQRAARDILDASSLLAQSRRAVERVLPLLRAAAVPAPQPAPAAADPSEVLIANLLTTSSGFVFSAGRISRHRYGGDFDLENFADAEEDSFSVSDGRYAMDLTAYRAIQALQACFKDHPHPGARDAACKVISVLWRYYLLVEEGPSPVSISLLKDNRLVPFSFSRAYRQLINCELGTAQRLEAEGKSYLQKTAYTPDSLAKAAEARAHLLSGTLPNDHYRLLFGLKGEGGEGGQVLEYDTELLRKKFLLSRGSPVGTARKTVIVRRGVGDAVRRPPTGEVPARPR